MSLRDELIQVAAVAVAIVEDLDYDSTQGQDRYEVSGPLLEVAEERSRQELKWGPQHHDPEIWLAILAEEVGEVAREIQGLPEQRKYFASDREADLFWMRHSLLSAEDYARRLLEAVFA